MHLYKYICICIQLGANTYLSQILIDTHIYISFLYSTSAFARRRVFIRGLRKIFASSIPKPLTPFGRRHLREALSPKLPHSPRSSFTEPQRNNLIFYDDLIKQWVAKERLGMTDIVVISADRSPNHVITGHFTVNALPTLTTHNRYLMIMSVACVVNGVADSDREFFRKPTLPERLTMQGFPAKLALLLPINKILFAAGNSYPVPLIIANLWPILNAVAASGMFPTYPGAGVVTKIVPKHMPLVIKALNAPGKVVNKAKNKESKEKESRKSRKKRDRQALSLFR